MRRLVIIFLFVFFLLLAATSQSFAGYGVENGKCVDKPNFFLTLPQCEADLRGSGAQPGFVTPCQGIDNFATDPCSVDDGPPYIVKLTMFDVPLKPDNTGEYFYCFKSDPKDCDDEDLKSIKSSSNISVISTPGGENVTFNCLTGSGDSELKINCATDGSNWFHSGKTYRVTLFEKKKAASNVIREAAFYVKHFYPKVISPAQGTSSALNIDEIKKTSKYTMKVILQGRNEKSLSDSNKYNDYWIQVQSKDSDYKTKEGCVYIPPGSSNNQGEATIQMPIKIVDDSGNELPLTAGDYVLRVKDGKDGNFKTGDAASCSENDFTYWDVPFSIAQGYKKDGTPNQGEVAAPVQDPFGKEIGPKKPNPTSEPICPPENKDKNGYCTKIPTALGIDIHTSPQAFVRDLFTIVLSIGGIVAIIFFIQAGYTLMTSAGNKEKIGAAREQITAAITGLIFIILSISILEFIGINILHIPGFGQ